MCVCACACNCESMYTSICVYMFVCMCVHVFVHVCAYVYVHALFIGILIFNTQLALVSFSNAVDHVTTISIKKSYTSLASTLSVSSFSVVVCP